MSHPSERIPAGFGLLDGARAVCLCKVTCRLGQPSTWYMPSPILKDQKKIYKKIKISDSKYTEERDP